MKDLLQNKLSELEFTFGVLIAIIGGIVKAVTNEGGYRECLKNGFMGFFVATVSGLIFIEYFNSPAIIVASMGLSGYSGATFIDSINVLGKTMSAFKDALNKSEIPAKVGKKNGS